MNLMEKIKIERKCQIIWSCQIKKIFGMTLNDQKKFIFYFLIFKII